MKNKKHVLIVLFLILFQVVLYFFSKMIEREPNVIVTIVDNRIPFLPVFVYFYFIWYLMIFIVPLLIYKYDSILFKKYCIINFLSVLICTLVFIVYPTTVIRPQIESTSITNLLVNFIYYNDTPPINCFPSIHCLLCFLFILSSIVCKKMPNIVKTSIICLSFMIILSTIFIKQHVVYDILGSLIIVNIVYIIVQKFNILKVLSKRRNKIENRNCK